MTESVRFAPVPAQISPTDRRWRGVSATTGLTIYIVLLCLFPSNLAISALGSVGRPAQLWALLLGLWWLMHRLQTPPAAVASPWQPVRVAYGAFAVIALISFSVAILRGQPADQFTPAISALVRIAAWGGVVLFTMDGITTMRDLQSVAHRLVIVVTVVAMLGLFQTFTGQSWLSQLSIPGFSLAAEGGVQSRGSLTRAAGTATHPLEFAMLLTVVLPIAVATAVVRTAPARRRVSTSWMLVGIIALATLVSASRSALLGFAVAFGGILPALSKRMRWVIVSGAGLLGAAAVVAQPGLLGTMFAMFAGASSDPSALSRTNGLERAPGFIAVSPFVGSGFGTFLPRYYIFDNQWVLIAVELGGLGLAAFALLIASGCWSAYQARRHSSQLDVRVYGQGIATACLTGAVLLAGFDGLAFPISGGVLFLVLGLSAALRNIAKSDVWMGRVREAILHDRPLRK